MHVCRQRMTDDADILDHADRLLGDVDRFKVGSPGHQRFDKTLFGINLSGRMTVAQLIEKQSIELGLLGVHHQDTKFFSNCSHCCRVTGSLNAGREAEKSAERNSEKNSL